VDLKATLTTGNHHRLQPPAVDGQICDVETKLTEPQQLGEIRERIAVWILCHQTSDLESQLLRFLEHRNLVVAYVRPLGNGRATASLSD